MARLAEDEAFENINFSTTKPSATEYEYCQFRNCNFAGADLSRFRFMECSFTDCDWSNVKLAGAILNDVRFAGCKILGVHFEDCNEVLFTVSFNNCLLNFSSFYKHTAKKTSFRHCSLQEVDFTDADFTSALFDNCDLLNAHFENTVLEKADLRTAFNYTIDPEINRIRKAKFSKEGLAGLLGKYDIEID
jgi:fluoroquinolone resistance protein